MVRVGIFTIENGGYMEEGKKIDKVVDIIQRALQYNILEVLWIVGLLIGYSNGGTIWSVALWVGFGLAALWSLLVGTKEAYIQARAMVLNRELYISDTITGACFLFMLAFLVRGELWQFPVMFLLAAGQHLRYTYLSVRWLRDERLLKNEHNDTNDTM